MNDQTSPKTILKAQLLTINDTLVRCYVIARLMKKYGSAWSRVLIDRVKQDEHPADSVRVYTGKWAKDLDTLDSMDISFCSSAVLDPAFADCFAMDSERLKDCFEHLRSRRNRLQHRNPEERDLRIEDFQGFPRQLMAFLNTWRNEESFCDPELYQAFEQAITRQKSVLEYLKTEDPRLKPALDHQSDPLFAMDWPILRAKTGLRSLQAFRPWTVQYGCQVYGGSAAAQSAHKDVSNGWRNTSRSGQRSTGAGDGAAAAQDYSSSPASENSRELPQFTDYSQYARPRSGTSRNGSARFIVWPLILGVVAFSMLVLFGISRVMNRDLSESQAMDDELADTQVEVYPCSPEELARESGSTENGQKKVMPGAIPAPAPSDNDEPAALPDPGISTFNGDLVWKTDSFGVALRKLSFEKDGIWAKFAYDNRYAGEVAITSTSFQLNNQNSSNGWTERHRLGGDQTLPAAASGEFSIFFPDAVRECGEGRILLSFGHWGNLEAGMLGHAGPADLSFVLN